MEKNTSITALAAVAVMIASALGGFSVLTDNESCGGSADGVVAYEPGSYWVFDVTGSVEILGSLVYSCEGSMVFTVVGNSCDECFVELAMDVTMKLPTDLYPITLLDVKDIGPRPHNAIFYPDGAAMAGTETISTIDGDVCAEVWETDGEDLVTRTYITENGAKCYMITISSKDGAISLTAALSERKADTFEFKDGGIIGYSCAYDVAGTVSDTEVSGSAGAEIVGIGSDGFVVRASAEIDIGDGRSESRTAYLLCPLWQLPADFGFVGTVTISTVDGDVEAGHWYVSGEEKGIAYTVDVYVADSTVYEMVLTVDDLMVLTLTLAEKNF